VGAGGGARRHVCDQQSGFECVKTAPGQPSRFIAWPFGKRNCISDLEAIKGSDCGAARVLSGLPAMGQATCPTLQFLFRRRVNCDDAAGERQERLRREAVCQH
jgi:hypothetical protein